MTTDLLTQQSSGLSTGDMEGIFTAGFVTLHTRSVRGFRFPSWFLQTEIADLR